MKPTLNSEQKAHLLLELLEWATSNKSIMYATSPQLQTFNVLHCIQDDKRTPVSASNNEVFIRELKKNGILWGKILPFLKNSKGGCKTKVSEAAAYGTCRHSGAEHIKGKCQGIHTYYDDLGNYLGTQGRKVPCSCTTFKTTQTW